MWLVGDFRYSQVLVVRCRGSWVSMFCYRLLVKGGLMNIRLVCCVGVFCSQCRVLVCMMVIWFMVCSLVMVVVRLCFSCVLCLIRVVWVVLCEIVFRFNVLLLVNRFSICVLFSLGISQLNRVLCMWLLLGCNFGRVGIGRWVLCQ